MKHIKSSAYKHFILSQNKLTEIKAQLPYGAGREIKKKLLLKYGIEGDFTLSYVNSVLNPNDLRFNARIVLVAQEYIKELKTAKNNLLKSLKKNRNFQKSKSL